MRSFRNSSHASPLQQRGMDPHPAAPVSLPAGGYPGKGHRSPPAALSAAPGLDVVAEATRGKGGGGWKEPPSPCCMRREKEKATLEKSCVRHQGRRARGKQQNCCRCSQL